MRVDAEQHGPQWASANDKRTTLIGRVLRTTHLDELPQLLNILRGDLSFVGPRPERPEFVEKLKEVIPYYDVRTFLKPGVTGWAQIHHRADQTIADVERKLEYDIYYLKRRSVLLDIVIILRTVKAFFVNPR
jgi:lipopolysaccharide/colanic/teichoic acid biosynthesis glycosyltransferase